MLTMTATHDETALIINIVHRYNAIRADHGLMPVKNITAMMDLEACHSNGCPIDFQALDNADDADLVHDVAGISAHIDRRTGTLGDGFCPRYADIQH